MKKLGELFPPENSLSPTLYRLAILREDLVYEMQFLKTERELTATDRDLPSTLVYFLRKASITVTAIKDVLCNPELGKALKTAAADQQLKPRITAITNSIERVMQASVVLRDVRDYAGAHIKEKEVKRVLSLYADFEGTVQIADHDRTKTFLSMPYVTSLMVADPVLNTILSVDQTTSLNKMSDALFKGATNTLAAIDDLHSWFWRTIGAWR